MILQNPIFASQNAPWCLIHLSLQSYRELSIQSAQKESILNTTHIAVLSAVAFKCFH